jgi:hypothetical protein
LRWAFKTVFGVLPWAAPGWWAQGSCVALPSKSQVRGLACMSLGVLLVVNLACVMPKSVCRSYRRRMSSPTPPPPPAPTPALLSTAAIDEDGATLYINGAPVGHLHGAVYAPPPSRSVYMGMGGFVGRLCDVSLYDRCLSAESIHRHYTSAVAPATASIGYDTPSSVSAALATVKPAQAAVPSGPREQCCLASGVLSAAAASVHRGACGRCLSLVPALPLPNGTL